MVPSAEKIFRDLRRKSLLFRRRHSASAFVAGDHTVLDVDDAVGVLGDIGFMRYQHNGVAFAMQVFHQLHDFVSGLRIKVAGGLVGQNDRRIIDEGAGNSDTLALSAGKFVGLMVHALAQIHGLQRGFGAGNAFIGGRAAIDQRKFDVVQCGGTGEQIERLEDKADFFVADAGQFVIVSSLTKLLFSQ